MVKIKEAILVEGRYDKNTLSQILDAPILETGGFRIFKDPQQLALLRQVAKARGLIVFTDPDGAGFVIRNHIKGAISPAYLKHAYIPDVYGKERRKKTAGKEGKLGVEGMNREAILEALRRGGATFLGEDAPTVHPLNKQDMMELGLSGGPGSREKRLALIRRLGFPEHMSPNALLQALQLLYTRQELEELLETEHG